MKSRALTASTSNSTTTSPLHSADGCLAAGLLLLGMADSCKTRDQTDSSADSVGAGRTSASNADDALRRSSRSPPNWWL